jgi:hypothetical protein
MFYLFIRDKRKLRDRERLVAKVNRILSGEQWLNCFFQGAKGRLKLESAGHNVMYLCVILLLPGERKERTDLTFITLFLATQYIFFLSS